MIAERGYCTIDLGEINLFRANLKRINLEKTNLTETNLEEANLNRAILTGASPAAYVMIQVTGIDPKEIRSAGFRALGI
jgi:uncharacterized protein YjbI with pentapeptide repeats